jgi:hypothetical protein
MVIFTASVVVMMAFRLLLVYLVFHAVAHGVPKDQDHEIEVKFFTMRIRRKVKR